ncbi:tetratricopeptide domain protein [Aquitalea magnusonii]|jgi:tetratricopeptide (TPR) repeat protein|uniref:Tetratricopeptide domain protein n=1 Tax=Aquitalea magnusonii TaxID=332411 RepID=A0A3G9GJG3_9NEIS|nr:tetratricopeptide repeat protein [Aquitalea magnusonii]BBF87003.1 tetratricopeptide domain protein [Aquitalea magnusonii]
MKPLNRSFSLLLVLLLSACTSMKSPLLAKQPASSTEQTADDETAAVAESNANLPRLELTPQIVYGVLASEIAAQRGAAGSSAATYLDLAKQTRDPRLAQRAAEFALFSGQLKDAADALSLWMELDPSSQIPREQLFITMLRSGKLAESQPLVEDLLKREPQRAPDIFVQLARLTARQNDKQAAYALVNRLASQYPDLPEARFAVIAVAAEVNDDATIQREFDRLAQIAPKWDLPVAWQTDRLRRIRLGQAIDFLQQELARRPDAGLELRMAYPRLLVGAKRFPEARVAFEALLRQNPDNAELLYASGLLAYQLRDLPAADQRLTAALQQKHPETDFIRFTLGQVAEDRQDKAMARQWYDSVGAGQQFLPAQARLAALDAEAGKLDEALRRLAPLGQGEQEKVQLAMQQAELARHAKRYDLSFRILTQALESWPRSPELLYDRALVSDQLGNLGDAERDLKTLLKEKPDDPQALNALGYTLANRSNRHQEALGYIEKALKADPDNPMILDSMGWVLFKLGRSEAALKYLERAYAAMQDSEVAAHLGEVLWKLGRKQDALTLLRQSLAKDPDNEALQDALKRFHLP